MDLKNLTDALTTRRTFLAEVVALGGFSFGGAAPSTAAPKDNNIVRWREDA